MKSIKRAGIIICLADLVSQFVRPSESNLPIFVRVDWLEKEANPGKGLG